MTIYRTRETHILTALLPQILTTGFSRSLAKCLTSKEKKWWAWQGLNLRPLRCQGRDTSAFPHISAVFGVLRSRTAREQRAIRAPVYRNLTAKESLR